MSEDEREAKPSWVEKVIERSATELRSPVAAIGFLLGLISVLPTLYGWLYPGDTRRLLLHYDPYTVYDPGKPVGMKVQIGSPPGSDFHPLQSTRLPNPPVKIISLDGEEITSPVYDMEVSIWNGGSEPINRDKIRRPLVLIFPHIDLFLGIRILHENPNDGLKISVLKSSPASVEVLWDYMDPGKGFKFAAVFAGSGDIYPLQHNGYLDARIVDTDKEIPSFSWRNIITTLVLLSLYILFGVAVFGKNNRSRFLGIVFTISIALSIPVLFIEFVLKGSTPPF